MHKSNIYLLSSNSLSSKKVFAQAFYKRLAGVKGAEPLVAARRLRQALRRRSELGAMQAGFVANRTSRAYMPALLVLLDKTGVHAPKQFAELFWHYCESRAKAKPLQNDADKSALSLMDRASFEGFPLQFAAATAVAHHNVGLSPLQFAAATAVAHLNVGLSPLQFATATAVAHLNVGLSAWLSRLRQELRTSKFFIFCDKTAAPRNNISKGAKRICRTIPSTKR